MLEMNKVMLIGNLTRDPELSYIASGTALAKLGVAVNRTWKDRNSGERKEETAFVDIDAWGQTAEFCSKYLAKGRRVYVEGRLKFDRWETPDGQKRSKLGVTADRVQFADSKPSEGQQQGGYGGGAQQQAPAPPPPRCRRQPRRLRPRRRKSLFPPEKTLGSLRVCAGLVTLFPLRATAAEGEAALKVDRAASEIKIDGRLDEAAWADALKIPLLYEWSPGDNDERRGFQFRVNPLGVQADAIFSEVDGIEDFSFDMIWDSAGLIHDGGYNVEMAIPLNQIRFPRTSEAQVWGFDVGRSYPRSQRHRIAGHRRERDRQQPQEDADPGVGADRVTSAGPAWRSVQCAP